MEVIYDDIFCELETIRYRRNFLSLGALVTKYLVFVSWSVNGVVIARQLLLIAFFFNLCCQLYIFYLVACLLLDCLLLFNCSGLGGLGSWCPPVIIFSSIVRCGSLHVWMLPG